MAQTRFRVYVHCHHDLGDMTLGQGHDTPLGHGQQLCEILFRSNFTMRSYGPYTDFGYVCTVTMTSEIWPWVKVMTHPLVIDNKSVKYYPDPTWQWGVMAQTRILGTCALWPWPLEIWPWIMVMTHPSVIDNKCVKYYPDPTWQWGVMAQTRIFGICALWPWPWRYDLGSKSWHTLGSWTAIVWNITQIQLGSEELWPRHGFPVYVHCDLDLGEMILGQGHDTPLHHGQQLCDILSRSNLAVRSYGPDTDFQYMCTVTLTLEIWSWVKVMTHPCVMDNNCVKLYPDRTTSQGSTKLWPGHDVNRRTDRRTDRHDDSYIPSQTLFVGV